MGGRATTNHQEDGSPLEIEEDSQPVPPPPGLDSMSERPLMQIRRRTRAQSTPPAANITNRSVSQALRAGVTARLRVQSQGTRITTGRSSSRPPRPQRGEQQNHPTDPQQNPPAPPQNEATQAVEQNKTLSTPDTALASEMSAHQVIDWDEDDNVPLRTRAYCQVPDCPLSNPFRAAGWVSRDTVRRHFQGHADGYHEGQIPRAYMMTNSLGKCSVCQKILHTRFGKCCPSCRPLQAARQETNMTHREIPHYIPTFETTSTTKLITKKGVPFGARREWAECLDMAIGEVLKFNDERAWVELWVLLKMVLRAPEKGGGK